jgi:hypothetical protein
LLNEIEPDAVAWACHRWKDRQLGREKKVREPEPREKKLEQEIHRLKPSLANRTLEVDFFQGALQTVRLDVSGIPRLPRGNYDENPRSDALARQTFSESGCAS